MMCIKTFQEKNKNDFNNWNDWVNFVNDNYKYSLEKSTINDFVGKCNAWDLPSYHPYWKNKVKENKLKDIEILEHKIELCKKDNSLIKIYFNNTTTIEMLIKKLNKLKNDL